MRFTPTTYYVNVLLAMAVAGSVSHWLLVHQASLGQRALQDAYDASDTQAVLALGGMVYNDVAAARRRSEALARASLAKLLFLLVEASATSSGGGAATASTVNISSGSIDEGVALPWASALYNGVSPLSMPTRTSPLLRDGLDDLVVTAPPLSVLRITARCNGSAASNATILSTACGYGGTHPSAVGSSNVSVAFVSGVSWVMEHHRLSNMSASCSAARPSGIAAVLTMDVVRQYSVDAAPSVSHRPTTTQWNILVTDDGASTGNATLSRLPLTSINETNPAARGCLALRPNSISASPPTAPAAPNSSQYDDASPERVLLVQDPIVLRLYPNGIDGNDTSMTPSPSAEDERRGDRAAKLSRSIMVGGTATSTTESLAANITSASVDIFTQVQLPMDIAAKWHVTLFLAACFSVSGDGDDPQRTTNLTTPCSRTTMGAAVLKVRFVASTDPTYQLGDAMHSCSATKSCEAANLTDGICLCPTAREEDGWNASSPWKAAASSSSLKFSGAAQLGQLPGVEERILHMMTMKAPLPPMPYATTQEGPTSSEDDVAFVFMSGGSSPPTLLKRIFISSAPSFNESDGGRAASAAVFALVHPITTSRSVRGSGMPGAASAQQHLDGAAWMTALIWMVVLCSGMWSIVVARRLFVLPVAALSKKIQHVLDLSQVWARQQPAEIDVAAQRVSLQGDEGEAAASFVYHDGIVGITSSRRGEHDDFFVVRGAQNAGGAAAWDDGVLSDVTDSASDGGGGGDDDGDNQTYYATEIKGVGRRAQSVSSASPSQQQRNSRVGVDDASPCSQRRMSSSSSSWCSKLVAWCCCCFVTRSPSASAVHPEDEGHAAHHHGSSRRRRSSEKNSVNNNNQGKSSSINRRKHNNLVTSQETHQLHGQLLKVLQLTNMFSKYVPKEVVKDLMRANRSVVSREMPQRMITLLFCDIANFTTFCEIVQPGDVVDLLDLYFTKMTSVLLQHGCTIDKYIGDAIMGFWGAPLDYQHQGFSSCCAALHMQYMVAKLRPYFASFQHLLHVRIGLHRGVAAVGNIGCSARISYTALGDAVNTAARLEGLNKFFGTKVCVSQSILDDMEYGGGHFFAYRALGSVRVKGKSDPLLVHELVGVRLSATAIGSRLAAGGGGGGTHHENPSAVCGDGESEYSCAAKSCHTGFSAAADKFAELSPDSEFLAAKKFKALSERQIAVLAKMDVAVSMYHRFEVDAAVSLMELILNDHQRTLDKLEIHTGKLREQLEEWRASATAAGIERSNGVFDPCINMQEK